MRFVIPLSLILCALPAAADEVVLKSGGKVTGIVKSEEGDRVVVEVAVGTATFAKADVAEVKKARTALHEYHERAGKAKSAAEHFELAGWAKQSGLSRHARTHYQAAVAVDPNHEGARRALGYTLFEGKWMTEREAMMSRGMVWMHGRWVTPEERLAMLQQHIERERVEWHTAMERERRDYEQRRRRMEAMYAQPAYGVMHRPSWFWPAYYRPHPWNSYIYKLPPNAWYWYRPYSAPQAQPQPHHPGPEEFERAVQAEVEKRVKAIMEEMEKRKKEEKK